jgi:hypothetical protein
VILQRARENLAQPESEPLQTEQSRLVQEVSNNPKELLNLNTPILKSKKGKSEEKEQTLHSRTHRIRSTREGKRGTTSERKGEENRQRKTKTKEIEKGKENDDQQTSATTESTICQTCGRKYHGGIN